jgi:hypothetical protein
VHHAVRTAIACEHDRYDNGARFDVTAPTASDTGWSGWISAYTSAGIGCK